MWVDPIYPAEQETAELALRGAALLARLVLAAADSAPPQGLFSAASLLHDNALLVSHQQDSRRCIACLPALFALHAFANTRRRDETDSPKEMSFASKLRLHLLDVDLILSTI